MRNKKIIAISIICAILFAVAISAISINHISKTNSKAAESSDFSKENIKNEQINVLKDNEINETRGDQKEETSEITSEEIVAENTEETATENTEEDVVENTEEIELTNNDDNSNNYQNDENSDIEYSNSDNSNDEESNNDDNSYEDDSNNESDNNSNHTHEHVTEKPTPQEPQEDHVVYKADGSIDLNQSYWAEGIDASRNCRNSKEMNEFKEYIAKKFQEINYYFRTGWGGRGPFSVYDLYFYVSNRDTHEDLVRFHFDGTKFVED